MRSLLFLLLFRPMLLWCQPGQLKLGVYNVGFGAISAAVGAVIHTPKGNSWTKAAVQGLWQGAAGGAIEYLAKRSTCLIYYHNSTTYALPAMILHNAGTSIVENAALRGPFLQRWHFYYLCSRLDISLGDSAPFRVRLTPVTLLATIAEFSWGNFQTRNSFLTGCSVFRRNVPLPSKAQGFTRARAFTYVNDSQKYQTFAHELNHVFQYEQYEIFNSSATPLVKRYDKGFAHKLFSRYLYPDTPYWSLAYLTQGVHSFAHYYRNFFEWEAQSFATGAEVKVY